MLAQSQQPSVLAQSQQPSTVHCCSQEHLYPEPNPFGWPSRAMEEAGRTHPPGETLVGNVPRIDLRGGISADMPTRTQGARCNHSKDGRVALQRSLGKQILGEVEVNVTSRRYSAYVVIHQCCAAGRREIAPDLSPPSGPSTMLALAIHHIAPSPCPVSIP